MKKNLFFLAVVSLSFFGKAQIFQEDFDGNGPGFSAWTLIDGDGLIPAEDMAQFQTAWIRVDRGGEIPNYGGPDGNYAAASTSWYSPAGTSNDWLISPQVPITGTSPHLIWDAKAQDGDYPDGYKVMLSTNGGNTIADFNIELFSISEEVNDWFTRKVDLTPYLNQTIRFAFVNNSNDQYLLLVDNILVDEYVPQQSPNCSVLTTPVNGATNVNYLPNIPLVWQASVGGGPVTEYNVHLGTAANALTLLGSTPNTSVNITGGSPSTTYYWQIVPKNADNIATGCTVNSFTTSQSPFSPYCGPVDDFYFIEAITNVTFAGINNTTPDVSETTHEIFLDQIGNVTQGESYEIRLSGNTEGDYFNKFHVYIDWNQNGVFDESEYTDVTNRLSNSTGTDGIFVAQNILVPNDALIGNTRMRVKKEWVTSGDTTGDSDPCSDSSAFGQMEDYTINVSPSEDLAIKDLNIIDVQVYPNPVVDFLTVKSEFTPKSISVVDISGRKVLSNSVSLKEDKIDLSSLPKGNYIVTIETEKGSKSIKVIKK